MTAGETEPGEGEKEQGAGQKKQGAGTGGRAKEPGAGREEDLGDWDGADRGGGAGGRGRSVRGGVQGRAGRRTQASEAGPGTWGQEWPGLGEMQRRAGAGLELQSKTFGLKEPGPAWEIRREEVTFRLPRFLQL